MDAITKIIEAALTKMPVVMRGSMNQLRQNLHLASPVGNHLSTPKKPAAPPVPALSLSASGNISPEEMQNNFMEALERLSHSHFNDTREKTLQALFAILQSSGQATLPPPLPKISRLNFFFL